MMPSKVTKSTRAGKNGKIIYCPKCGSGARVYGFDWVASTCDSCWQMVEKVDYFLEPPDKSTLPQPLPPMFTEVNPARWALHYGDGTDANIAVRFLGKPGAWGPCIVIDGTLELASESIADAKTLAMERLAARRKA